VFIPEHSYQTMNAPCAIERPQESPTAARSNWLFAPLLLIALCSSMPSAQACNHLSAGALFWVRLTVPISSYSAKPGMPVQAILLKSPECDKVSVFSTNIPVEGRVLSVRRVGLGLWHETAALELAFLRILPTDHSPIEINGRVELVDNARESVKNGVIRGIRSTDTPQGLISSRLKYLPSPHLYPDPVLLGYKLLFPVFPEPEINLESGADMQVQLAEAIDLPADLPATPQIATILDQDGKLRKSLTGLPERTSTKQGKAADVINMVFAGSRADLEHAFQISGWQQSEEISAHTVLRQFYSYLAKSSYATAPMSAQLLAGSKPNLTLEKAFQSNEKRNHLRIWELETTWSTLPLWASAAVRETGATLSIRHKGFIHHVSEDLDEEQQTVLRDLSVVDCVDSVGSFARPALSHLMRNATGELFRTNGSLLVVRLKPCGAGEQVTRSNHRPSLKSGSRAFRYLRRQILTVRSDLWRANCIYALFDLTRRTLGVVRQSSLRRAADTRLRQATTLMPTSEMQTPLLQDVNGPDNIGGSTP